MIDPLLAAHDAIVETILKLSRNGVSYDETYAAMRQITSLLEICSRMSCGDTAVNKLNVEIDRVTDRFKLSPEFEAFKKTIGGVLKK
jgi:hypothetical protein